ncbi:DNA-directed DNA polymerase [Tanacetum coccineum]|uniref:DNA-directed DNA polymerase n=1 Tax=Tanacetum coccineum TaxID=301880 RepID=A0ABQ5FI03_9ASTR
MPKYDKFMKVLFPRKGRTKETSKITLNERCSAVLLNKIPFKEKYPRSFTIPCVIGKMCIDKALADLGAIISLMPYSMYARLDLGELKRTRMCFKLANKSTQYPKGIAKNVIVKIDKFIFPVDFVVLDIKEDRTILIILGRPFLATTHAMIDVFNKKISFEVGNETIMFDIEKLMKFSTPEDDECLSVDMVDKVVSDLVHEILPSSLLDSFLFEPIVNYQKNDTNLWEEKDDDSDDLDKSHPKLKDLPSHQEFAFLNNNQEFPVIISSLLNSQEKESLLKVLTQHKATLAWKVTDIKGISPSFCTHKILMKDNFKPVVQPQRRLNPKVQDVVKAKIVKLLDNELIYAISDGPWVNPIHVVPKKGG